MNKKTINPWEQAGQDNPWPENDREIKVIDLRFKKGNDFNMPFKYIIAGLLILWGASGFYQVNPNQQGVVLRFGKYVQTTDAGLHYHLPYPIEEVKKVNTTQERSINLGIEPNSRTAFTESHMLTGDENIVDINLTIVWKVKSAKDYLFNMTDVDNTVRVAAQSVLREIIGQSEMQPIITGDRGKVEDETKEELQNVLDEFGAGVQIVRVKLQKADPPKQVVDAFNEVQRARADMERFKNEAEAYRNEILPKAKGEAVQRIQNAEAYKQGVVQKALGETQRYKAIYNSYKNGKEVTRKRMYIEAMEDVLGKVDKVIFDNKNTNVLPLLQLNDNKNPIKKILNNAAMKQVNMNVADKNTGDRKEISLPTTLLAKGENHGN